MDFSSCQYGLTFICIVCEYPCPLLGEAIQLSENKVIDFKPGASKLILTSCGAFLCLSLQLIVIARKPAVLSLHFSGDLLTITTCLHRTQLVETWSYHTDNLFAERVIRTSRQLLRLTLSAKTKAAELCEKCKTLRIGAQPSPIKDSLQGLQVRRSSCDFCNIRWDTCRRLDVTNTRFVVFDRIDSHYQLKGHHAPVLTVHQGRGPSNG